jgi:DNA-directed RNA polymerase specialized sigma54-like protein
MKRYSFIAVAMLFISANVFAFGYGYNPAYYQQQEIQMQQQQLAVHQQQMLQLYVQQQIQAGNMEDPMVQQFIAAQKNANPVVTRNVTDQTQDYRQSTNNALEEQRYRYFQANPTVIDADFNQTFKIEGQQRVREAEHQAKLAEIQRNAEQKAYDDNLKKMYCQSLFQDSPQDQFKCAQFYMAESYTNGYGYRKYNRSKTLKAWFPIY